MKKELLFIALSLFAVLLISLASAVEIKLSKEEYAPSETLQAEILGNFIDIIKPENIYFYRERNVPVIYDILKLKDKYLLYALLPYKEGNYTIKIKNTRYETGAGASEAEIVKEFSIKATNETSLSINPGFIFTKEDFYIEVKANKNTKIDVEFLGDKQSISLVENKEEKVYFSTAEIKNYTETTIKIKDYNIPAFIFSNKTQIIETGKFRFSPAELKATILKGEKYFFSFELINLGRKNITNIRLFSNASKDLTLAIAPESIPILEAGEKETVNLTIVSEKIKNFSAQVFASSENLSATFDIGVEITKNKSKVNSSIISREGNCSSLGGKICKAEETCEGTSVPSEDGSCCIGECKVEEDSSSSWLYGLIIIIVIIAGLILFSFYMKKRQGKTRDVLKERQNKFEERMEGEEVHRSLAKT